MPWWTRPTNPKNPPPNQPPGAPIKSPPPKKQIPPQRKPKD